jgi:C_GCAxxG_C_C family probable redox protein
MAAFGGGLGANGEVCGAVVGGLACIGLRFGRAIGEAGTDTKMFGYSSEFLKRFREEIAAGCILCREIAQVDWRDPEQVKAYREGGKSRECLVLVGKTAKLVGELLERSAK